MASVKILIFLGLLALGFLIPSEVAATNIGTKPSSGRDEAITNPAITMVTDDADQNLNRSNVQDHKSLSFDVSKDDYADFIQKIRDELKNTDSHGIPVLTPQQRPETPQNTEWLDIRLVAGSQSITVRLQQSNLYLCGYASSTGNFWQFSDANLITNANNLSFSGSYVSSNGVGKKSPKTRENLTLGRYPLRDAVNRLAALENPNNNVPVAAENLLVIIQMIAEAARFRTIADHISTGYDIGVRIDSRMMDMENGWGQLSNAVLQLDRNPVDSTPLPHIPPVNPTLVYTFGQALAALGILLIPLSRTGQTTMMTTTTMTITNVDYGRSLMNLEYVRVNNIDGENPGDLYGTVRVDDGWFTYTFYDRASGDHETVGPGEFATLTDSAESFPVSGADALTITVDLYDYDVVSYNDKIAQGEVVWDTMTEIVSLGNYDKHLQQVVRGDYGDVTVGYSVLSSALGVTIKVVLVNGDGESPADVFGTLRASQVLGGSDGSITLFDKSEGEYVGVRQWDPIPLSRKIIAASTSTKLKITADLWDYDWASPNDAIAQGSVEFTVQSGEQNQYIYGKYGQVQVFITCE